MEHSQRYDCKLTRAFEPLSESEIRSFFENAGLYPLDEGDATLFKYRVFPQDLNQEYLQKLFLEDCYKKDILKGFV
jgi:hypothetical protein